MHRITVVAMLASASSLLACQLAFTLQFPRSPGMEHACPADYAAVPAPQTVSGMITRFEEWKGGVCIPRLEKPFRRG